MDNIQNLELEITTLYVSYAGAIVNSTSIRTKTEHVKIKGVAIMSGGGYTANDTQGLFRLRIDKNQIIADSEVPKFLFEVSHSKTLYEAAYKCDIPIKSSDIDIQYVDESDSASFSPYTVKFILICEKTK